MPRVDRCLSWSVGLLVLALGARGAAVRADPRRPGERLKAAATEGERKPPVTVVNVELVTTDDSGSLRAYRWVQVFEKLKVAVTIRRSEPKDKPAITEKKTGDAMRQVQILGRLERDGQLSFADRTFNEDQVDKLAVWLEELRAYGAQGSPDGQPAWGLTKPQFSEIYQALARPLPSDPHECTLAEALKLVQLPPALPLRSSERAARRLSDMGGSMTVGQSLTGVSQGTALAAMLDEHGLGFRPRRLPNGSVELSIVERGEAADVWPVGWPREQGGPATAPTLYEMRQIELDPIEVDAMLAGASDVLGLPVLLDRRGLADRRIDLSQVRVAHPRQRTIWSLALRGLLSQAKARFELLVDEAGQPFLWVAPIGTPRRTQEN